MCLHTYCVCKEGRMKNRWKKLCCGGRMEIILVFLRAACEAFQCFYSRGWKGCVSVSDLNFCIDVFCETKMWGQQQQPNSLRDLLAFSGVRPWDSIKAEQLSVWCDYIMKSSEMSLVRSHVTEKVFRPHTGNIFIFSRLLLLMLK